MYHIYAQINSNSYYNEDRSLFYHKADKRVVNINLNVVKHNKATVGLLTVSKMSQNKIILKTLNGNISSTMYASTSLFICFGNLLLKVKSWLLGWCRQQWQRQPFIGVSVTQGPGIFSY